MFVFERSGLCMCVFDGECALMCVFCLSVFVYLSTYVCISVC